MSFITGLGGLLGGATNEAHTIHQERAQERQQDLEFTANMYQHLLSDPNFVDPVGRAQAYEGWRDHIMETLFPDNYKSSTKNPVKKLVDQFVEQRRATPGAQVNLPQFGVGRGNATTQVGASNPPPAPPAPAGSGEGSTDPNAAPVAQAGQAAQSGPPAPPQGMFVNPYDAKMNEAKQIEQFKTNEDIRKQDTIVKKITDQDWFKKLTPDQQAEVETSLRGGHYTPQRPDQKELYNKTTGKMELHQIYPDGRDQVVATGDISPSEKERALRTEAKTMVGTADAAGMNEDQLYDHLVATDTQLERARYMAQTDSARAETAYHNAMAKYYQENKVLDPNKQAQSRAAFDALNEAQSITKALEQQAQKDAEGFEMGPNGHFVPKTNKFDYESALNKQLDIQARSIGWTPEEMREFFRSRKLPDEQTHKPPEPTPSGPGSFARATKDKSHTGWLTEFTNQYNPVPSGKVRLKAPTGEIMEVDPKDPMYQIYIQRGAKPVLR